MIYIKTDPKDHTTAEAVGVEVLNEISTSILSGVESRAFKYGLVIVGEGVTRGFYPLPLLFSNAKVRAEAAKRYNTAPPTNRWVRETKAEILDLLGLEEYEHEQYRRKTVMARDTISRPNFFQKLAKVFTGHQQTGATRI